MILTYVDKKKRFAIIITMNIRNEAFKQHVKEYDEWFIDNEYLYKSELEIFKELGIYGKSIEIGVGTGKFAIPLGIKYGVEPTYQMYSKVRDKVKIVEGVAEYLPIKNNLFDWVIMVTTICFVNDPLKSILEMYRILKKGGKCAIGFVDKDSPLGKIYQEKKSKSKFYYEAIFYSTKDVIQFMKESNFKIVKIYQTLYGEFDDFRNKVQKPIEGYGKGSFVVIVGEK
ncbi:S-adenosylmethionine-dependent methyltransferase [Deferribacter desulfuricans SSM1]|uniref:S-adenosylmethionine-dependent methyltransferase n=2 Tax=Deferribacter TaxID=53572 RepID=D3P8S4_DEFDS|nr:S-adenosylmethionine-dependent methyltransferase [Deferribacter desulfuricans SSM1]